MTESTSTEFLTTTRGVLTPVFKFPILLYRLGLGRYLDWTPFLILTTKGHVTGLPRPVALEYRRHGSKYYLLATWGEHTYWVQNILRDSTITFQHGNFVSRGNASVVDNKAEALKAVYMFRRNSPLYGWILSRLSTADTIDFRTLTDVADQFTVIRIDPCEEEPTLPQVRPIANGLGGHLIIGGIFSLMIWFIWRLVRHNTSSKTTQSER